MKKKSLLKNTYFVNFHQLFSYNIFKFRKQQMFATSCSKTQFMYFDEKNKALGEHSFSFPPPIFIICFKKYKKSSRRIKKNFKKNYVRRRIAGNFQLFFVVCVKYRLFRQAKYKQFVSPRLSSPSTIDF